MRVNPDAIRQQIANLLLQHPELEGDEVLRADMIEGETDVHDFLASLVDRIGMANAMANGVASYQKDVADRKTRYERRAEALRELAFKIMSDAKLNKVELAQATISVRNGTQRVVITDEAALPLDCVKTSIVPDKTAIKEKLSAGQPVAGAFLSNAEPTLAIRTK